MATLLAPIVIVNRLESGWSVVWKARQMKYAHLDSNMYHLAHLHMNIAYYSKKTAVAECRD